MLPTHNQSAPPIWADRGLEGLTEIQRCYTAFGMAAPRRVRRQLERAQQHLRIDTVDKKTVACVDMQAVTGKGCPGCCRAAIGLIHPVDSQQQALNLVDAATYAKRTERRGVPASVKTADARLDKDISKVIEKLATDSGLFTELTAEERTRLETHARHVNPDFRLCDAGAFTVEKASDVKDEVAAQLPKDCSRRALRMILDARPANAWMSVNTSYPIFPLRTLQQVTSNVMHRAKNAGDKPFYIINSDLRHWYHELPLPERLRLLFQLKLHSGMTYVPRALPMGWSPSCRVAQAVTWALLLGVDHSGGVPENPHHLRFQNAMSSSDLPEWMPFKHGDGGIFVMLDNVFVITSDKTIADYWEARMKRRAAFFKAEFKTSAANPTGVRVETVGPDVADSGKPQFLGIQFGYDSWRVIDKTYDDTIDPTDSRWAGSSRRLLSFLGQILWDLRVRDQPLRRHRQFLDLYRVAHPADNDWDGEVTTMTAEQFAHLKEMLDVARERRSRLALPAWEMDGSPHAVSWWATDAAGERLVAVSCPGASVGNAWIGKPNPYETGDIAIAELEAIGIAVEAALRADKTHRTLKLIVVATDSMCAKGWIERGCAENPKAHAVLCRILDALESANVRIMCPYIHTDSNIADVPTREIAGSANEGKLDFQLRDVEWRRAHTNDLLRRARAAIPSLTHGAAGERLKTSDFDHSAADRRPRET